MSTANVDESDLFWLDALPARAKTDGGSIMAAVALEATNAAFKAVIANKFDMTTLVSTSPWLQGGSFGRGRTSSTITSGN